MSGRVEYRVEVSAREFLGEGLEEVATARTIALTISDDPQVAAATLRAAADKLDPPRTALRNRGRSDEA